MSNYNIIKKINKKIVHEDGSIDSFEKQLLNLMDGKLDITFPLVIEDNSRCLNYIQDINMNNPLVINASTIIKLKEKHNIGYSDIAEVDILLANSVLAFDSLTQNTSKVILLDKYEEDTNDPMIAVCRFDKDNACISVNEITSIYDKRRFKNFLVKTYDQEKKIYKNKKTELYFKSARLQLPLDLKYALSNKYNRTHFTKSQVENDYALYLFSKHSVKNEGKLPRLVDNIPVDDLRSMMKSNDWIIRYQVVKHKNSALDILVDLSHDNADVIRNLAMKRLSNENTDTDDFFKKTGNLNENRKKSLIR